MTLHSQLELLNGMAHAITADIHLRLASFLCRQSSELPFCRAFILMNFQSESLDLVVDFCVNFLSILGALRPFNRLTPEVSTAKSMTKSLQNPRM